MILNGTYIRTIFKDFKTGYTIFSFKTDELSGKYYEEIVCNGYLSDYTQGMPIQIDCVYDEANKLYKTSSIKESASSEKAIIEYLSSGICKGIGEEIAKKIYLEFKETLFDEIDSEDFLYRLSSIKGITKEKAENLQKRLKSTVVERQLYNYLSKYNCSYEVAKNIYNLYGNNSLKQLKKYPYSIGYKSGLSFSVCDNIAKKENSSFDNEERLKFIIRETLYKATKSGNTFIYLEELEKYVKKILKESSFDNNIHQGMLLLQLLKMNDIVLDKDETDVRIYNKKYYDAEKKSADNIKRFINGSSVSKNEIYVNEIEQKLKVKYDKKQKEVFHILDTTGIKILTGGPGTGKTTVIKGIIENFKRNNPYKTVLLCAPTGRASQRMEESIGLPSSTIHKMLGLNNDYNAEYNIINPLDADLIIIDESSMIDIRLLKSLLEAIKTNSIVIFVGDTAQLPSVGAGNVLKDMINSECLEVFKLEKIFRQELESSIVYNSIKILNGKYDYKTDDNFEVIRCKNPKEINESVVDITNKLLKKGVSIDEFEILSPTRVNDCGTIHLNKLLQKIIYNDFIMYDNKIYAIGDYISFKDNGIKKQGKIEKIINTTFTISNNAGEKYNYDINELSEIILLSRKLDFYLYNGTMFRIGDKIITTRNNYDYDYTNGDMGYIKKILPDGLLVEIDNKQIEITSKNMDDVELAYSITIHKSQGSEYDLVIIPLKKGFYLKRNLLFTAITRAKKSVIIISENDAYEYAIANNKEDERNTFLCERIKK